MKMMISTGRKPSRKDTLDLMVFCPFDKDPDDDLPFHGFEEDPED
jgi:hypothetical protein